MAKIRDKVSLQFRRGFLMAFEASENSATHMEQGAAGNSGFWYQNIMPRALQ